MRIDLGEKTWIIPMPVLIIGTYDDEGKTDAMNAAWGGIYDYNIIGICISSSHKTTKNILKSGVFTVSFADKDHVKEADFVGIVSGNDVPDKIVKSGLTPKKSDKINAPLFEEFPLTLECSLLSYDEKSGYMTAKIINVSADEKIVEDGDINIRKFNPLVFETIHNTYMTLGDTVANAFSVGEDLK